MSSHRTARQHEAVRHADNMYDVAVQLLNEEKVHSTSWFDPERSLRTRAANHLQRTHNSTSPAATHSVEANRVCFQLC